MSLLSIYQMLYGLRLHHNKISKSIAATYLTFKKILDIKGGTIAYQIEDEQLHINILLHTNKIAS